MRFEHLVEINDPLMTLLDPLTRDQLWRGLVRRASDPTRFVLGLVGADVAPPVHHDDGRITFARRLDFGAFHVTDEVELVPQERSITHVAASAHFGASQLVISIEEPRAGRLFLRFLYESLPGDTDAPLDEQTRGLRDQAYYKADLDTVTAIRELAAAGELGQPN